MSGSWVIGSLGKRKEMRAPYVSSSAALSYARVYLG
jgi:hypothetical protein